jgi:hypothetical protein
MLARLVLLFFSFVPATAFAGGGWVPVEVISLRVRGETEYVLVVRPAETKNGDYFLDGCKEFVVHGYYSWRFMISRRDMPNRKGHLEALKKLEEARKNGKQINFGWNGQGFQVREPSNPCEVDSRGLAIVTGGLGDTGVVSFFKAV